MENNVTRFPIKQWQKIKNSRGKKSVSCEVTNRWLRFSEPDTPQDFGTPVWLDVMTDTCDGSRKLARLCVTVEALEKALEAIKGKRD